MAPLEANAAGRPVVAFKGGGALETIVPGLNGIFFDHATPESLIASLEGFEEMRWQPAMIRAYSEMFDREIFQQRIRAFIKSVAPDPIWKTKEDEDPILTDHPMNNVA